MSNDFGNFLDKYRNVSNENRDFRKFAIDNNIPIIRQYTEDLLKLIISVKKPRRVLEIGTAIGFSTVSIYKEMEKFEKNPDITTIEKNEKRALEAKKFFNKLDNPPKLLIGDADDVLNDINRTFDLIFLDGPKGQYINYLERLINILDSDGILFVDNISHNGDISLDRLEIKRRNRTIHKRLREFIDKVSIDPRLDTTLIPLEDGIAICRKKENE